MAGRMRLLEYLDARHARKMAYKATLPYQPLDAKLFAGSLFLLAYYGVVAVLLGRAVPTVNAELAGDALLVLGPAVGMVINALFRTDRRDEEQARNTGEGFRAMRAQAEATQAAATAGTGDGLNAGDRPAGTRDDPVHTQEERTP